jgi:two-component system chemotaxis response regulator CheY
MPRGLPDAILLDWNMPVMDGLAFLTALRRLPGGSSPVVIFCTTVNELAHIEQALDAGADEYVMKPFDEEIIHAKFGRLGSFDASGR